MILIDGRVFVHRPITEVFAYVTDLRNETQWWRGMRKAERISGDGGVGTLYRQEARLLGMPPFVWDAEVTAYEPPYRQVLAGTGRIDYLCHYEFAENTWVDMRAEIAAGPPFNLLGRWLRPTLTRVLRSNLRRLDRVLAG